MNKELGFDAGGKGASRFLPIPTDDEGKPANTPDIRISNKVYKEEEMLKVFKVVNPQRKQRKDMEFFPDLTRVNADGYFIAFDHNNTLGGKPLPVGRVGWKYMRQHGVFLTVGVKVIPMYRGLGIAKKLWEMRDRVIFRNRPAVGFLSNFTEGWVNYVKSRNWNIEPPVSTLPESLVADAEKTITERGKPRKLITYNMPGEIYEDEAMAKAWDILKMGVIGTVVVVDGKKYHFSPDDVERYRQIYQQTMANDPKQKKRIALRNVIRERNIQPKVR
jgi:GNAT superfamily N-acetyltransferase